MYNFKSIYARYLADFLDMKKSMGFKCSVMLVNLRSIDTMAQTETTSGITREFADRWGIKRLNESDSYRYSRVGMLAQFSKYLCNIGVKSYIPYLPPCPKNIFIPYIYSPEEMEKIFAASDDLKLKDTNMESCMFAVPTMIRMLYATGIRISEAIYLKDEHVNLNDQYLLIKDCKNGKERLIPISDSALALCRQYLEQRDRMPIVRKTGFFFVKFNGKKCSQLAINQWFKKVLQKASVRRENGHLPRVHDLRHTFAVTSLASMARCGVDLYASLPILSNYLGHQSFGATNHYVRLAAHLYPSLITESNITSLNVFPKFTQYEAD